MTWMMAQSAHPASMLMMQSWEEWLTHQGVVLSFRKTFTGWRMGLAGVF